MPRKAPREAATEALGRPVEDWIAEQRASAARLTYVQLARILSADYGVTVTDEAVRLWANDDAGSDVTPCESRP